MIPEKRWTLARLEQFDEIIDVRSPAEYAQDHIPGAGNFPVLDDDERADVGTVYKQVSAFEAKKRGAAKVAANVARHLQRHWQARGDDWRPLVYCWRGGTRSAAMVHVLNEVGWPARQLPGGYKAYRRQVIAALDELAPRLGFRVLCGRTGVGKSRLLEVLRARGRQVLDLEDLARHRGSVLGEPATGEQPQQRWFESLLCRAIRQFDLARPVYVEAESRRIGRLHVPEPLIRALRGGRCIRVEAGIEVRVPFLVSEYRRFLDDPGLLERTLARLTGHVGAARVRRWLARRDAGDAAGLVRALLEEHYDPLYLRSIRRHFRGYDTATRIVLRGTDEAAFDDAATRILAAEARCPRSSPHDPVQSEQAELHEPLENDDSNHGPITPNLA